MSPGYRNLRIHRESKFTYLFRICFFNIFDTKPKTFVASVGDMSRKASFPSDSSLEREHCAFLSFKQFLNFLNLSCRMIDLTKKDFFDTLMVECFQKGELNWQDPAILHRIASNLGIKENEVQKLIYGLSLRKSREEEGAIAESPAKRALQVIDQSSLFEWDPNTLTYHVKPKTDMRMVYCQKRDYCSDLKRSSSINDSSSSDSEQCITKGLDSRRKISITKKEILQCDILSKSAKMHQAQTCTLEKAMKQKLGEVIQEGLLDSVLPYVVPKDVSSSGAKKSAAPIPHKKSFNSRVEKSLSRGQDDVKNPEDEPDCEVVIHVSDEVKNLKREYKCSQKLLVSKMGYFAEVTTGQKLEDMDISVHCDMDTFDWLIRWIKKETVPSSEWPLLDAGNVLPNLVSAAFLQMDPLLSTCLLYCHDRMNEVIETSDTIGGLNDNNIVRLCDMFSNIEVEQLEDRRDKIKSRLYTKLIVSLVDSEVDPQRGHYSSLRNVFRCAKCDKLVLSERRLRGENLCYRVPCRPENMWLGRCGDILSFHDRDIKWNLKDHIVSLFETTKSWREVYWRLWGECHFLYCGVCRSLFPACQMQWCLFHKEAPQFFTMEHQRTVTFPIGRYPCCGMKAFRFDPLENSPGCQFKEHEPVLDNQDSMEIFKIFRKYEKLISVSCSVQIIDRQKLSLQLRLKDKCPWWGGLAKNSSCSTSCLVPKIWEIFPEEMSPCVTSPIKSNSTGGYQDLKKYPPLKQGRFFLQTSTVISDDDDSTSEDSPSSEEWSPSSNVGAAKTFKYRDKEVVGVKRLAYGAVQWSSKRTTRTNQDHQRCHEEEATRKVVEYLTRRADTDCGHSHSSAWTQHLCPPGGAYIRLEQEWRAANSYLFIGSNRRTVGGSATARPRLRVRQ